MSQGRGLGIENGRLLPLKDDVQNFLSVLTAGDDG